MGIIDTLRLEKVKQKSGYSIARCPACAETGGDRKGEHLIIYNNGEFGCVVNQGEAGHPHRQRIFALVGITENCGTRNVTQPSFTVKALPAALYFKPKIIRKDLLGRLGRLNSTYARKEEDNKNNNYKECPNTVPTVPDSKESSSANDLGTKSQKEDAP